MSIKPNIRLPLSVGETTVPVAADAGAAAEIFGRIIAELVSEPGEVEALDVPQVAVPEGEKLAPGASVDLPGDAQAMLALAFPSELDQEPERTLETVKDRPTGEALPTEPTSIAPLWPAVPPSLAEAVAPEASLETVAPGVPQPFVPPEVKEQVVIAGATPAQKTCNTSPVVVLHPSQSVVPSTAPQVAAVPATIARGIPGALAGAVVPAKEAGEIFRGPLDVTVPVKKSAELPHTVPGGVVPIVGAHEASRVALDSSLPPEEANADPEAPQVQVLTSLAPRQPLRSSQAVAARPGPPGFLPMSLPELASALMGGQRQKEGDAIAVEPQARSATFLPLAQLYTPAPSAAFELPTMESVHPAAQPAELMIEQQLELASDGEWLDQLARDIATGASGKVPLRFRLNPEHLGSLRVELTQDHGGTAVRLTADTEAARAIIADAQPRLLAEARAQGLRISEAQVDLAGRGGSGSADARRQNPDFEEAPVRTAQKLQEDRQGDGKPTPRQSERYA